MFYLPNHALIMSLSLILLLIGASLIVFIKVKRNPAKDYRELVLRTRSWGWMIAIILAALLLGAKITTILFAFISFLALKEFYSITPLRTVDRRLVFLGLSCHSCTILLGLYSVVWHVYYLHPGVYVSLSAL